MQGSTSRLTASAWRLNCCCSHCSAPCTPLQQPGVICYPKRALGLCGGMTGARLVTTTEVYPDSPTATPAQCNAAQMATVTAAIEYLLRA